MTNSTPAADKTLRLLSLTQQHCKMLQVLIHGMMPTGIYDTLKRVPDAMEATKALTAVVLNYHQLMNLVEWPRGESDKTLVRMRADRIKALRTWAMADELVKQMPAQFAQDFVTLRPGLIQALDRALAAAPALDLADVGNMPAAQA
jgi:hypothetical protein